MRTLLRTISPLSLSLILLVSGCAMLGQNSMHHGPDTGATIDKMIAAKQYGKALELLNKLEKNEGEAATGPSRKKEVQELIDELEKKTIAEAKEKEDREELQAALTITDNALNKVPASLPLQEFRNKLAEKRARATKEASIHLKLLEANYLLDRLKIYERQAQLTTPTFISRWQMDRMKSSLTSFRTEFLQCEEQQKELGNSTLAEECFRMADWIQPDPARKKKTPPEEKTDQPEELSAVKKKRPENLLVPAAPKSPVTNIVSGPSSSGANSVSSQTDANQKPDDALKIEQYMEEGSRLYRAGKIKEARDVWRKVLAIDGQHQAALKQVARAEKIISHLESLKAKQAAPVKK